VTIPPRNFGQYELQGGWQSMINVACVGLVTTSLCWYALRSRPTVLSQALRRCWRSTPSRTGLTRREMDGCVKPLFEMMAAYNGWANERLFGAVRKLPDAQYRSDRGAFFGSIQGTLNHILIGDRIWMHVFTGEGERPRQLDAILYDDLDTLWAARRAEDARISAYVSRLSENDLLGTVHYKPLRSPTDIEQHLAPLLLHVFNHQTHHRGQAHAILTHFTPEAPSLDLVIFQRQTGVSLVSGAGGDFSAPERRSA
jgi:uncharacterized damage-inducible protein DinB